MLKNLVDTEVMLGLLRDNGYTITEDLAKQTLSLLIPALLLRKPRLSLLIPSLRLLNIRKMAVVRAFIVAGCLSQQYQDELFQEIPEIDALIGTGAWDQIYGSR